MKRILLSFASLCATVILFGQETFNNPIIPGFHPDPSICRVGDDFYLVTSSFEWYPGIPIYHSRDLMNWEQIGHVLTRPSQLALNEGMKHSRGLWAPTIRNHEGLYYVICTAQDAGGTFYVTAESPYGPWSEPVFLKEAPGIDPSIFFDDDGKCWFTATVNGTPDIDRYLHEDRIYLQELDLAAGKLVGERKTICTGHAVNAPYAEAPHIYKIGGTYYLLIAEGGTWEDHAVTIFTSDKVTGPYTAGITNPVLTHRFLGKNVDITTVGHADLVQDGNGRWWAVMLGVRPIGGYNMLGRETFITPVEFQDGWPVFNPGIGRVLMKEKATGLKPYPFVAQPARDEFDGDELAYCWSFLRTTYTKWYELKNGFLRINLRKESVFELVNPSLIARRIDKFNYTAQTEVIFKPSGNGEEAGLIVMQNAYFNYRLVKEKKNGKKMITLYKTEKGRTEEVASIPSNSATACLKVISTGLSYKFFAGDDSTHLHPLGGEQDASINSTQKAGGFIGPFIGMYASSNGKVSSNHADFEYFEFQ